MSLWVVTKILITFILVGMARHAPTFCYDVKRCNKVYFLLISRQSRLVLIMY